MNRRSIARIGSDVRALGPTAPLRAAYEASKRSGFHSILFRESRTGRDDAAQIVTLCRPADVGPETRARCLQDAAAIIDEGVRVFGRRVDTGIRGAWSLDPLTSKNWPEGLPWWRIDIRSEARLSDVKFVWEAARHRDLVVLARATALDPDGPWADELATFLTSWCEQNPPERGVHWYSSLELALRAIAWAQVLQLAGDRFSTQLRDGMDHQLRATARHLLVELPYTLSSMRNNHLLGDALGLLVLARLFPEARGARRWSAIGNRLFDSQLARHMRPDGSMIEDSLSYHRFVLEMLVVRVLLGEAPTPTIDALRGAGEHLRAIVAADGSVPQFGDWDEGRVLASSGDALDVYGSAALALALTGSGELATDDWDRFDELAWYAPRPPESEPPPPVSAEAVSGGIARVERGPFRVWFKAGAGPSHGHADLTSVWVQQEGRWLVSDPGTGTYNGALEVRNGFRTSAAHPVRRPNGQDQLIPHRAFRWMRQASGHLAVPLRLERHTLLFGWHDAYESELPSLKIGRAVLVADQYVAVVEFDSAPQKVLSWSLTVPLQPGVSPDQLFGLRHAEHVMGSEVPFAGWFSRTYGQWEPTSWLVTDAAPKVWGVGAEPDWSDGTAVTIDGLALEVAWSAGGGCLHVYDTGAGRRRYEMRAE